MEHLAGTRARTVLRVRRNVLGVLPILTNTRAYSAPPLPLQIRSIHPLIIRVPAHASLTLARHEVSAAPRVARRSALGSPSVTEWVRLLSRVTSASAEWHVPRTKSFTTTTYCGTKLEGSLEVTSDEKAEREGRCSSCVTHLATTLGIVPQRPSRPMAQAPATSVPRAAAKQTAAKKTVGKPVPKGLTGRAPVAKRPVRRARRGRA